MVKDREAGVVDSAQRKMGLPKANWNRESVWKKPPCGKWKRKRDHRPHHRGRGVCTFHTYEAGGVVHLKTTFWYPMTHNGDATPGEPQAIEGITDVTWLKPPFPRPPWTTRSRASNRCWTNCLTAHGRRDPTAFASGAWP